ncbi:MAG: response regulator transcription factor [Betaproteobacteria bacterium]|nr:response regulator transcription factor [Betaproteobacteria bacterium]
MKFLVVDDVELIRLGMEAVVGLMYPDAEIRVAGTLEDAFRVAGSLDSIDLVLLDLELPGWAGLSALEKFRAERESWPVVVVSGHDDRATVVKAIDLGASGFISKKSSGKQMRNDIQYALEGGFPVPPDVLRDWSRSGERAFADGARPAVAESTYGERVTEVTQRWATLTDRERDVMSCLVAALPNKSIANRLKLDEQTVKGYVSSSLEKLGACNRTEAAVLIALSGVRWMPSTDGGGAPPVPRKT